MMPKLSAGSVSHLQTTMAPELEHPAAEENQSVSEKALSAQKLLLDSSWVPSSHQAME